MTDTENIVFNMTQLRKRAGFSGERLADAMREVGCPWERAMVAKLENGYRKTLRVEELVALAKVFNTSMEFLCTPPDCECCLGIPPIGFTCNACGKVGANFEGPAQP